jgi:hypothetical protein
MEPEVIMTSESVRYRGYEIIPSRQWSQWGASVYATEADLPILSSSVLRTLKPRKEEALAEAKRRIDRLLTYPH